MNAASRAATVDPPPAAPVAIDDGSVALTCDAQGVLRRVLHDGLDLTASARPGEAVARLVDADARSKFDAFIAECAGTASAVDWQIAVPRRGRLVVLHFAGLRLNPDELLVVASARRLAVPGPAAHGPASAAARRAGEDVTLYDELMRVNNELINVQRQLAKSHRELERLNHEKNRWLGIAAHDLRSPLAIVQTYAEFLEAEAGEALGSEARGFLATIGESAGFMKRLVDDLLDVAQIEAGGLRLQRELTDIGILTARIVALNRVLATRKGIAIECRTGPHEAWALIDVTKIEQVLNNLIGNAVKFSPPGSTVAVHLHLRAEMLFVRVADQGPGIAADEQARLFRPFVTATARGTAGEKSTGLGLAIVRRVVEAHGGRINVYSAPGRGAVFHFSLPLAGPEAAAP